MKIWGRRKTQLQMLVRMQTEATTAEISMVIPQKLR